ncbi:hypothetical protein DV736_g6251, partial [Chaetothyriales sp. CBS 134916]
MAEVEAVSFGAELKDGYKPVDNWVTNGIAWLGEIQEFYQERAAIEREYSARLTALAKKYYDRKAKKSSSLSVGDTPALTPGSLESASLTTWTTQLSTLETRANDHLKFGQDLISQVANPLEFAQKRLEELRKSHTEYQGKLIKERDSTYSDLKKLKAKYDSSCQEVESRRKKTETSFDSSKSKAQSAYNQQLMEMNNIKNTYLIGINVTNKLKECYYFEYVPELLDSLQDLAETRTARLNAIWTLAAHLESTTLRNSDSQVQHLLQAIPRNNPSLDSSMFVRHNAVQWSPPPDFIFEPSPVWLDSDAMAVDQTSKIFLRNILSKSKPLVNELKTPASQKRRELENVKRARDNVRSGRDKRDEVDCVRSQFAVQEELHVLERKLLTVEVETSTIMSVVGDLSLYGKSHTFKSETFKIPTNCDFCCDRIWGLSAKGSICTDCGFTCHIKCQMKVPAECPGEQTKEEKRRLKVERQAAAGAAVEAPAQPMTSNGTDANSLTRQGTMNSLSSGYAASATRSVAGVAPRSVTTANPETGEPSPLAAPPDNTTASSARPRRNRIVAPPPAAYTSSPSVDIAPRRKGRMLYPYEKRDDGEVSVDEGKEVTILEGDDGGWTKVKAGFGGPEGLVPTAYLEEIPGANPSPQATPAIERPQSSQSNSTASLNSTQPTKKKGPAVAPKRGAKKVKYCEALYAYEAQSDMEFSMEEGDRFILISMGDDDGWADVEKMGTGEKGNVPANYIQEVP